MTALVRGREEAVPAFWMLPGERGRRLASDAEALTAARRRRLTEPDLPTEAVAAIRAPTLLDTGALDEPGPAERAARPMPKAAFVALEGHDHAQGLARSDLVRPHLLRFLAGAGNAPADRS